MIRTLLALAAAALLSACVTTTPPVELRPGLTAAQVAQPIRKPLGRTYNWRMTLEGEQSLPAVLTLRSSSAGNGLVRMRGRVSITLPAELDLGSDPNAVAREISQALTGSAEGISFAGRNLNLPSEIIFDSRGRARAFQMLATDVRYAPSDCFSVVGDCSYTAVNDRGQTKRIRVSTTESGGVWRAELRDRGGLQSTQIYTLDRDGVMLDVVLISTEDGRPSVTKLERF